METHNPTKIRSEKYKGPAERKDTEAQVVQLLTESGLFPQRALNQVCAPGREVAHMMSKEP